MKALLFFVGWLILLVISWPLALLVLVLAPIVWLISLPFRLLGMTFVGVFAPLKAVLMLPARIFGPRGTGYRSTDEPRRT